MYSLLGASKVLTDVLAQEFGRYFGMKPVCFRGGCQTCSGHPGSEMHGILASFMKCTLIGSPYTIFDHKRKLIRDNIHSHYLVTALWISDIWSFQVEYVGFQMRVDVRSTLQEIYDAGKPRWTKSA